MATAAAAAAATSFQSPTFEKDVKIAVNEDYTAASISPSGRDVVLAGTQGILIIDLDNPYSPPRYIRYRIGFEVADVQWSPFASRAEWIASTNNNKALIFNLNLKSTWNDAPIQFTLDAHQGNITDINFSAHHPDMLATCALDTNIFTWDLRTPATVATSFASLRRTPSVSFADWQGGATQVKWNRQNEHVLASSHDRYVQIWDIRRGATPITTIHAHFNKVYGIDWHRTEADKILTCSLDKTAKQWDGVGIVADITEPSRTIFTDYPLLRARHTPFPNGIITMPQHGSASLSLYEQKTDNPGRKTTSCPSHVFVKDDHEAGRLHEFLWRTRGDCDEGFDNREFQLVTWATDHCLRLHSVSTNTLKQVVGFEKGGPIFEAPSLSRKGAQYITFADGPAPRQDVDQVDNGSDGFARKGTLSSLFKNSVSGKAGLATLFQGPARATMTARSVRRDPSQRIVNHVTWMHNVNIEKSKPDEDGGLVEQDTAERFNPTAEIKAADQKYPNVTFELVNLRFREVVVAFKAPWGDFDTSNGQNQLSARKLVFLRLTIRFPDKYPGAEGPLDDRDSASNELYPLEITFEKTTAAISSAMVDHLRNALDQIARAYAYEARPALDAVLSYALGDSNLDEVIAKAKNSNRLRLHSGPEPEPSPVGEASQEQKSSSEEEEEDDSEAGGFNNDLMHSSHSNTNIPRPAQTISKWSNLGFLVSIRLPRTAPNMNSSVLLTDPIRLPRHLRQNPSKDDIFETFGRITTTHGSESPGSSLISWESSSSPSSSSGSDSDLLFGNYLPPLPWQKVSSRLHTKASVPSSADPTTSNPKAIVTILDDPVAQYIPSKKALAEQYQIFGNGPKVCLHNSAVARKNGYADIADIWQLCSLILNNEVPLDILPQQHRRDQVLVLARRVLVRIKRKDSGLDLQFDEADTVTNPKLKGRVKWGHHPVVTWLIPAIFDHFERLADTQMLAMLSCIFSEPAAREGVPSAMAKMRQSHLPMSMEAPAFSLDYFASTDAAWSLFKSTISNPSTPAHSRYATPTYEFGWHRLSRHADTFGSHGSSNGLWGSDIVPSEPVTPYSPKNTPPILSRTPTFRSTNTAHTPYSTSPEQSQNSSKKLSSTGFSSALATLGKSFMSSSPPVKSRTEDLSTSAPTSGVTWGTTTFYDGGSQGNFAAPRAKHGKRASFGQMDRVPDSVSDSDSEYDTVAVDVTSEYTAPISSKTDGEDKSTRIKVTLKNQDQFDDEASVSAPLLDMSKEWLYRAWREQYAEMLGCWGLISQRAEVLKFNGLISYFPFDDASQVGSKTESMHLALRKEDQEDSRVPSRALFRSSTLAPPVTITSQFKRSPATSPRHFSFNPEAMEFKPANSFTPVDELPAPPPDIFMAAEQYLRLSIPTPATEATLDPFDLPLGDSKLSPYLPDRNRPSLSRGTSNVSGYSSVSRAPTSAAVSPKKSQTDPIYSCSICWIRVSGRFYLCPACGHVAHFKCMSDELGIEEGDCVIGCGCGCGFEGDEERDRIEDFIEGVRNWEERGRWLPEIEFDEDASTRAYRAFDADREENIQRWKKVDEKQRKAEKKIEKVKTRKKARVTGKSYY